MKKEKIEINSECIAAMALLYNYIANQSRSLNYFEITSFNKMMQNLLRYQKSLYTIKDLTHLKKSSEKEPDFGFSKVGKDYDLEYLIENLEQLKLVYNYLIPSEIKTISLRGFLSNQKTENPLLEINVNGNDLPINEEFVSQTGVMKVYSCNGKGSLEKVNAFLENKGYRNITTKLKSPFNQEKIGWLVEYTCDMPEYTLALNKKLERK